MSASPGPAAHRGPLVLFWDIDGTLLLTGGAGLVAWSEATTALIGRPIDLANLHTAGLTDVEIAADILKGLGLPADPAGVDALVRGYEARLVDTLARRSGRVLAGVREILEHLRDRPDVTSLLLTGNTAAGARAKLGHYGLAAYFRGGAFADGAPDRPSIARRALEIACGLLGSPPAPERTFVIGDTPRDIACAQAINARAVAVASGAYALDELLQHEPWWAVERLPAPAFFLSRLEDDAPRDR
jgi:phosphoglycolate phosphatase-like HAD superfamily hydrolase